MALFQYQALDERGKKKNGLIEAHSDREAKAVLREQGVMITKMTAKSTASANNGFSGAALQTFTVQLSQLVNAGIPLYESLVALEEQYRNESFHQVILSLCEQIKAGSSLSEAMANYPGSFDKLYRAMISAVLGFCPSPAIKLKISFSALSRSPRSNLLIKAT